jgi:hypothetical protein
MFIEIFLPVSIKENEMNENKSGHKKRIGSRANFLDILFSLY